MPNTDLDRSYPSAPITFADVPEVRSFQARFEYNFFVPDESVTDRGIELDRVNDNIERKIQRDVPRLVRFRFSPVHLQPSRHFSFNEFRGQKDFDEVGPSSIEENLDKIRIEHELTSTPFTGIRFQDNQVDGKLHDIVSGTVTRRVERHNKLVGQQFNATQKQIDTILKRDTVNLYDAAKLLSTGQGSREAKLVVSALNQLQKLNARFIDSENQQERIDRRFERVKEVGLDVQINSKFVYDVLTSIVKDPFSLYIDEVKPILATAAEEQQTARATVDPGSINADEYETFADPVSTRNVDISSFNTRRRIVGYIIDKFEVQDDGTIIDRDPIIIQRADASFAFDTDIAYNRRYVYSVRAIAEVEFVATMENDDDIVAATILISSKPSTRRVIDTVETIPPPPPADFNVDWDRTASAARLMWCFPVNMQRDIKKWQIFRRSSIYEPFTLIKEYDFDNSMVRIPSGETVSPSLTEVVRSPVNFYIDRDFSRASKYIYAVCAIDAHGLTSNYSVQFEARYDQAMNDIVKRLVSASGAPKSYPNMYVNQDDVIVDVIRDSSHSQVAVYFDPEYLDVEDTRRGSLKLLSTDRTNGLYRMQLINTDLQQGRVLDIVLRDRRRPLLPRGKFFQRYRKAFRPVSPRRRGD